MPGHPAQPRGKPTLSPSPQAHQAQVRDIHLGARSKRIHPALPSTSINGALAVYLAPGEALGLQPFLAQIPEK